MCGMKFSRHHHFTYIFERKSKQLFTGGIFPYYADSKTSNSDQKRYKHLYSDKPKVLNLRMLEPGFVIWTTSLLLAIITFISEWLMTLKDLIVIYNIFAVFFHTKHETERLNFDRIIQLALVNADELSENSFAQFEDETTVDPKEEEA